MPTCPRFLFFSFNKFGNNEVYCVAVVVEAFLAISRSRNSLAFSLIVTQMRGILLCCVPKFFKDLVDNPDESSDVKGEAPKLARALPYFFMNDLSQFVFYK